MGGDAWWGGASFVKVEDEGEVTIYMSYSTTDSTLITNENGAFFLFKNGERLEFPSQKIDVEVSSRSGWRYSAFIQLNKEDIKTLTNSPISDVRLFLFDREYDDTEYTEVWRQQLICLIKDTDFDIE